MTVEEILNGESKEVEYKEMVPANSKKYTKTAVAYANCAGGLLIFGVENNTWKVTGIPQEKVFEVADGISNAIVDSCVPMIDFDIKYQTIEGKTIIIVQVYPGKRRPYYLKSEGKPEGVYIRVPGSTRVADDFIVKELEFQGSNRSYDQIVAVGESVTEEEIEVLCDKMYQYALSKCRNAQEEESVKKVTKKNLLTWGLLQMQEGKVVPTNGYMLLTNNTMPEASIQCGVFKGTNRAVFLDRKEYAGPIYEQIDEAYQFVLRNIRMGAEFGGLLRRDVYELPIDSIRELIANAVIHRSYLEPSRVQVALYDDRLEITSPGMLIGGFTIEDLKAGCCQARNRGIVNALTYMKIIEQWGSGIPRLLENCKNAELREPELLEIGGSFRVNMFRNTELTSNNSGEVREKDGINEDVRDKFVISSDIRDKFGENAAKIAGLMCEKPESTLDEIATVIGVTRRTVEKQVKKLKEAGIVVRVGSNKCGVWKVTESGK
ncbi:MAG: putative DNA binding domain-containing protein [Lachnospiraceae bacterium]|nr:putative DNA binding domain-containing protein [Lachnospiraceae bacterium]